MVGSVNLKYVIALAGTQTFKSYLLLFNAIKYVSANMRLNLERRNRNVKRERKNIFSGPPILARATPRVLPSIFPPAVGGIRLFCISC